MSAGTNPCRCPGGTADNKSPLLTTNPNPLGDPNAYYSIPAHLPFPVLRSEVTTMLLSPAEIPRDKPAYVIRGPEAGAERFREEESSGGSGSGTEPTETQAFRCDECGRELVGALVEEKKTIQTWLQEAWMDKSRPVGERGSAWCALQALGVVGFVLGRTSPIELVSHVVVWIAAWWGWHEWQAWKTRGPAPAKMSFGEGH